MLLTGRTHYELINHPTLGFGVALPIPVAGRVNTNRPYVWVMTVDTADAFITSLADLDVGWTCTESNELEEVLTTVAEPPVVGSPFPYEDLSMSGMESFNVQLDPTLEDIRGANTGITRAALGIADYGSVVLRSDETPTAEAASLFVDTHVAVLGASDIRPDMGAAVADLGPLLREENASAIIATGPSATADMGSLVQGAHGPKTVHVVLLTDR